MRSLGHPSPRQHMHCILYPFLYMRMLYFQVLSMNILACSISQKIYRTTTALFILPRAKDLIIHSDTQQDWLADLPDCTRGTTQALLITLCPTTCCRHYGVLSLNSIACGFHFFSGCSVHSSPLGRDINQRTFLSWNENHYISNLSSLYYAIKSAVF